MSSESIIQQGYDNGSATTVSGNVTSTNTAGASVYISPIVLDFFLTFNLLICGNIVGLLGISGNIINIIVFYKQGYEDSVNITLTALAVSDIGALVFVLMVIVMINPWFLNVDVSIVHIDVATMLAFYPHNYFIRVCGFITAFASCERCLCVLVPLKVKQIVTKRFSLLVNVFIFIVMLLDLFPVYYVVYLDWTFIPNQNKSLIASNYRQNPFAILRYTYFVTEIFVPYFTFFVIILSNVIIGLKLNARSQWLNSVSHTNNKKDNAVSNREKRVVLMLIVVSVIFIVCLIPQSAILTALIQVQDLGSGGRYFDVSMLCYSISYLMEAVCSSVNILVYYKMSSKYRKTLCRFFKCYY
ncbi:probable G-protein coupled receptor frpr-1 [Physella acuta]|uniref:probable G-protein coupled receptor frpr-1 n=1 Tax=Physella acuta TaxID=109671 RepID=UPI0027DB7D99|nr:probable G-protein coupled receptor frpr-1 [Physella acuta]